MTLQSGRGEEFKPPKSVEKSYIHSIRFDLHGAYVIESVGEMLGGPLLACYGKGLIRRTAFDWPRSAETTGKNTMDRYSPRNFATAITSSCLNGRFRAQARRGWAPARTVLLVLLALVLIPGSAALADPIVVSATVTPSGSLFYYDYTVTNNSSSDLFLLDIAVTPGSIITGRVTPTGFVSAYDSGLGLVSFLEDTLSFGTTAIDGFAFYSPVAPGPTTFTASLLLATTGEIGTLSGSTIGPTASAGVAEPETDCLLAVGLFALVLSRRKISS